MMMTEKEFDLWEAAMCLVRTAEVQGALQALNGLKNAPQAVGVQGYGVRLILQVVDDDVPACGRFLWTSGEAAKFLRGGAI